jgi:uracil-DNA glycosylase
MPTRDDILVELGLAPIWRRRPDAAFPGAGTGMDAEASAGAAAIADADADAGAPGAAARTEEGVPAATDTRTEEGALAATDTRTEEGAPAATDPRARHIAALEWGEFAADVDGCTACGLARTRRCSVPGVGDPAAEWLFVGEAPGAEEDERGEPFVGQAGKLLDAMLAALSLARGRKVYIANVLKCRPPGNRTPEPAEVEACRPYLDRQIELIRPKLIVALGRSAANTLLSNDATIASLRGRVHRYRGVPLIVTYHPAYLLRNLPDKAKAWEDLLLARRTAAG